MTSRIQLFKPVPYSFSSTAATKSVAIGNSVVTISAANSWSNDTQGSVVLVEVLTDAIYCTFDGNTTPSSSYHTFAAGYRDIWSVQMWNACKAIRVTTDAKLVGTIGNY
jgi:hypothetical protein